ncbi:hypothetical protein BSY16_4620 (plasmid) [Sinorhizobium sp. RAC02]|nr:hypothetical protein BSY16_4620 [Sinorhizobium sp. RAC02]
MDSLLIQLIPSFGYWSVKAENYIIPSTPNRTTLVETRSARC